jgi:uncharacterized protein YigE (DUF2233 family)
MVLVSRFALLALLIAFTAEPAVAEPCRTETFQDNAYVVCSFDLAKTDLRLFWRNADGVPFGTFTALAGSLGAEGDTLQFAMNGGMYDEDYRPMGLYVEDGKELSPLNRADSPPKLKPVPNFFKKPNGVFYFGSAGAGVLTTEAFLAARPTPDFATQSGPMLVIDGAIHPAFIPGSSDRKQRNGVGMASATKVHFAISEGSVTFYEFALFFRDRLGCRSALFLDGGSAPGLYAPELDRNDAPGHGGYGPIVGVVVKVPGSE